MSDIGIVRWIGWTKDAEGKDSFRALIEFPKGPPDLPIDVVWKPRAVKIVVIWYDDIDLVQVACAAVMHAHWSEPIVGDPTT